MDFKITFLILFILFCNASANTFAQNDIDWKQLDSVFSKIITTEDFRLTKKQKEEMISTSDYNLEMVDTFFQDEYWKYEFDDFFQTDYLIFRVERFEERLQGADEIGENHGVDQVEKIISQILGKDYIKFKNAEVIERENRTDDNVLELIEQLEGAGMLIQWMHFTDVEDEDFIPLKKTVRIMYDVWFDELTITFIGVDRKME